MAAFSQKKQEKTNGGQKTRVIKDRTRDCSLV